jgi:hypothetical protein
MHQADQRPLARPQRRICRTRRAIARPVVYSLCDATGLWSQPYADAGFDVRCIDLSRGSDVRFLEHPNHAVYGVLAAPPCTRWTRATGATPPNDEETAAALAVCDACLRFIVAARPHVWALENPPGQLDRWLGPPVYSFQPHDFGDPYTKRTYLWGKFNVPSRRPTIPTRNGISSNQGDPALGWMPHTRSATPRGFAAAFFAANSADVALPAAQLWDSRHVPIPRQ